MWYDSKLLIIDGERKRRGRIGMHEKVGTGELEFVSENYALKFAASDLMSGCWKDLDGTVWSIELHSRKNCKYTFESFKECQKKFVSLFFLSKLKIDLDRDDVALSSSRRESTDSQRKSKIESPRPDPGSRTMERNNPGPSKGVSNGTSSDKVTRAMFPFASCVTSRSLFTLKLTTKFLLMSGSKHDGLKRYISEIINVYLLPHSTETHWVAVHLTTPVEIAKKAYDFLIFRFHPKYREKEKPELSDDLRKYVGNDSSNRAKMLAFVLQALAKRNNKIEEPKNIYKRGGDPWIDFEARSPKRGSNMIYIMKTGFFITFAEPKLLEFSEIEGMEFITSKLEGSKGYFDLHFDVGEERVYKCNDIPSDAYNHLYKYATRKGIKCYGGPNEVKQHSKKENMTSKKRQSRSDSSCSSSSSESTEDDDDEEEADEEKQSFEPDNKSVASFSGEEGSDNDSFIVADDVIEYDTTTDEEAEEPTVKERDFVSSNSESSSEDSESSSDEEERKAVVRKRKKKHHPNNDSSGSPPRNKKVRLDPKRERKLGKNKKSKKQAVKENSRHVNSPPSPTIPQDFIFGGSEAVNDYSKSRTVQRKCRRKLKKKREKVTDEDSEEEAESATRRTREPQLTISNNIRPCDVFQSESESESVAESEEPAPATTRTLGFGKRVVESDPESECEVIEVPQKPAKAEKTGIKASLKREKEVKQLPRKRTHSGNASSKKAEPPTKKRNISGDSKTSESSEQSGTNKLKSFKIPKISKSPRRASSSSESEKNPAYKLWHNHNNLPMLLKDYPNVNPKEQLYFALSAYKRDPNLKDWERAATKKDIGDCELNDIKAASRVHIRKEIQRKLSKDKPENKKKSPDCPDKCSSKITQENSFAVVKSADAKNKLSRKVSSPPVVLEGKKKSEGCRKSKDVPPKSVQPALMEAMSPISQHKKLSELCRVQHEIELKEFMLRRFKGNCSLLYYGFAFDSNRGGSSDQAKVRHLILPSDCLPPDSESGITGEDEWKVVVSTREDEDDGVSDYSESRIDQLRISADEGDDDDDRSSGGYKVAIPGLSHTGVESGVSRVRAWMKKAGFMETKQEVNSNKPNQLQGRNPSSHKPCLKAIKSKPEAMTNAKSSQVIDKLAERTEKPRHTGGERRLSQNHSREGQASTSREVGVPHSTPKKDHRTLGFSYKVEGVPNREIRHSTSNSVVTERISERQHQQVQRKLSSVTPSVSEGIKFHPPRSQPIPGHRIPQNIPSHIPAVPSTSTVLALGHKIKQEKDLDDTAYAVPPTNEVAHHSRTQTSVHQKLVVDVNIMNIKKEKKSPSAQEVRFVDNPNVNPFPNGIAPPAGSPAISISLPSSSQNVNCKTEPSPVVSFDRSGNRVVIPGNLLSTQVNARAKSPHTPQLDKDKNIKKVKVESSASETQRPTATASSSSAHRVEHIPSTRNNGQRSERHHVNHVKIETPPRRFNHDTFGWIDFPDRFDPRAPAKLLGRDERGRVVFYPNGPCLTMAFHVCTNCRELGHTVKKCPGKRRQETNYQENQREYRGPNESFPAHAGVPHHNGFQTQEMGMSHQSQYNERSNWQHQQHGPPSNRWNSNWNSAHPQQTNWPPQQNFFYFTNASQPVNGFPPQYQHSNYNQQNFYY